MGADAGRTLDGRRVVIVHGWSDRWQSMTKIGAPLAAAGATVYYVNYDSREDKALYEDFAEGLQHELAEQGLLDAGAAPLHFVTHSTGALVLRQWLRQFPAQHERVGNVVFLAPPHFGSPLASLGNSLIGKIFKGQHGTPYDDFEVGRHILHGLELASPFAWELAEADLLGPRGCWYTAGRIRASVITGHAPYGGLRRLVNKPGTDGTIVVAGANLNVRLLELDFAGADGAPTSRWRGYRLDERALAGVPAPDVPMAIHADLNHATILELEAHPALREQVVAALATTRENYGRLRSRFARFTEKQELAEAGLDYQQFVVRVVDDRGRSVPDYHLEFNVWRADKLEQIGGGPRHVPGRKGRRMTRRERGLSHELDEMLTENLHIHSQDSSYKRYLVRPARIRERVPAGYVLTVRIDAKSGDEDIWYATNQVENFLLYHPDPPFPVRVPPFLPNTTTLVQIRVNRESELVRFGRRERLRRNGRTRRERPRPADYYGSRGE